MKYTIDFSQYTRKEAENILFFDKYENIFLFFLNNRFIGNFLWKFFGFEKDHLGKKIVRFTPSAVAYQTSPITKVYHFRNHQAHALKLQYIINFITFLSYLTSIPALRYFGIDAFAGLLPVFVGTITTFNVNGDGSGRVHATNATYSTARNATTGTANNGNSTRPVNSWDGSQYFVARAFEPFDTSSLDDGATIQDSANTFLRLKGSGVAATNTDSDSLCIVASTQASNTALVNDDYDNIGSTKYNDTDLSHGSWNSTAGANNDMTFNATGVAAISKTGYTPLALRTTKELAGTTPTGHNYVDVQDNNTILSVETGTAYTATYSETITISETFRKATTKTLAETITVVETLTKQIARTFTAEAITVSETFTKATGKSFTEAITIAETLGRAIGKNISETITVSETFRKAISRSFTETITIVDTLEKLLQNVRAGLPKTIRGLFGASPVGEARDKDKPEGVARDKDKPTLR